MAEYWDRERDRERGRRYRGESYYGGYYGYPEPEREYGRRGDDRGFFERAGDEVRSWFGDEEAQRRRLRDEGERDERGGFSSRDRRREDERRWGDESPRGWGYSGGYGAGAGYVGGRGDWSSGSGGYEPSDWTAAEDHGRRRFAGRGSTWGEGRYEDVAERMRRGVTGGPHVGKGPRGYQRSDERIREDVCERLSRCGDLDASDLEVRVNNGEVTLQGGVRARYEKRLAEDVIEDLPGVREIHNQIRVNAAGHDQQQQRYRIA